MVNINVKGKGAKTPFAPDLIKSRKKIKYGSLLRYLKVGRSHVKGNTNLRFYMSLKIKI